MCVCASDVSVLKRRLLPDPTNLPGVVGQGAVFTLIGLAYYDVGVRVRSSNSPRAVCSHNTFSLNLRFD